MLASSVLSLLTVAALGAQAITVTSPTKETVWSSGDSSETVTWSTVSTDPNSFNIVLVNMASFPTTSTTLNSDVDASSGSLTVSYPSGDFPVGTAYQINIVNNETSAILAQSAQFNITESASSSSSAAASSSSASASSASSSSAAASTTATGSTASMVSSLAASATSAAASSGSAAAASASSSIEIPGAASVSSTSGAFSVLSLPSALLVGVVGLVGAALV